MKNILRTAVVVAALTASLAGCTSGGNIAGTTPNSGTSATGGTSPTAAPSVFSPSANTTANSTTHSTTASQACTRPNPAASDEFVADASLGAYNGQHLPAIWNTLSSEAQVTTAINNLSDADFICFQKFYPGATTQYFSATNQ